MKGKIYTESEIFLKVLNVFFKYIVLTIFSLELYFFSMLMEVFEGKYN